MLQRSFILLAAVVSLASAAPMPLGGDSAIGSEIPVSAPNGTPMSDPVTSTDAAAQATDTAAMLTASPMATMAATDAMGAAGAMGSSGAMASGAMMGSSSAAMSDTAMGAAPTYGSGSSSWGGSGYNNCVQQCAASFGSPAATWTPSSTQGSSGGSSGGNGMTHTVIVAPTQGVLRYIPFSTNASVGDTVKFVWGAGPHTVTQSSALTVCNKTSAPGAFASGQQDKGFEFEQLINNTKPLWFYCGIPGHCQKGMFGGINIVQPDPTGSDTFGSPSGSSNSSSSGSSNSSSSGSSGSSSGSSGGYMPLSSVMTNMTSMSSDMSALWGYTKKQTAGNAYANGWGMGVNCAGMSQEAMMQTAQNVMYMQTLIAVNPQAMKNGQFAVTDVNSLKIPQDLHAALAASSPSANATSSAGAAASSTAAAGSGAAAAAPAATASPSARPNGAGSLASSSLAVGVVAVVATFFAL